MFRWNPDRPKFLPVLQTQPKPSVILVCSLFGLGLGLPRDFSIGDGLHIQSCQKCDFVAHCPYRNFLPLFSGCIIFYLYIYENWKSQISCVKPSGIWLARSLLAWKMWISPQKQNLVWIVSQFFSLLWNLLQSYYLASRFSFPSLKVYRIGLNVWMGHRFSF